MKKLYRSSYVVMFTLLVCLASLSIQAVNAQTTYLLSPSNGVTVAKTSFNVLCATISGATTYNVELNTLQNFSGTSLTFQSTTSTVAVSGLAYNTTYYTRAYTNLNGAYGKTTWFSTGAAPTPPPPPAPKPLPTTHVISPSNGAILAKTSFDIVVAPVTGATTYTVELNSSEDFSGTAISLPPSSSTTIHVSGLDYGKTYYAWAKTDLNGNLGDPIGFFTKILPLPTITSIVNANNDNGPIDPGYGPANISYQLVSGAKTYTIDVSGRDTTSSKTKIGFKGLTYGLTYSVRAKTDLADTWTDPITLRTVPYVASNTTDPSSLKITITPVKNATTYYAQLDTSSDFSTAISGSGTSTTIDFSGRVDYGKTYYVRVRTNLASNWCEAITINTVPWITSVKSPNGVIVDPYSLQVTVSPVEKATTYYAELSTSPDFSTAISGSDTSTTINFKGLSYSKTYYARAKTNLANNWGNQTTTFYTVPIAPNINEIKTVIGANNNPNSVTVSITGSPRGGSSSYTFNIIELKVDGKNVITNSTLNAADLSNPSITPYSNNSVTYGTHSLVVKVQAKTDLSSEWGPIKYDSISFDISKGPYVVSPGNRTTVDIYPDSVLHISITPISGAIQYYVEIDTASTFSTKRFRCLKNTIPTINFSSDSVVSGRTYYVRVSTDSSSWGSTTSFTVLKHEQTHVIFPPNTAIGASTLSPLVIANTVSGASKYFIELNIDPNFGKSTAKIDSGSTARIIFSGISLAPNTKYYTRVKVKKADGLYWGTETTSFTTVVSSSNAREAAEETIAETDGIVKETLSAYPNPFKDNFNIIMTSDTQQNFGLTIFDSSGREVHSSVEQTNQVVEVGRELGKGLYLIRVNTTTSLKAKTVKVIKE